jgi:hypothetical protein
MALSALAIAGAAGVESEVVVVNADVRTMDKLMLERSPPHSRKKRDVNFSFRDMPRPARDGGRDKIRGISSCVTTLDAG